jgi:hypothetical protein
VTRDNTPNRVLGSLAFNAQIRTATTYEASIDLRVDKKEMGPPPEPALDEMVIAQVLKQAANGKDWDIVPLADLSRLFDDASPPNTPLATDFNLAGTSYGAGPNLVLPGPFLVVNPTGANGLRTVHFKAKNLSATQKVTFNILAIIKKPAGYVAGTVPNFPGPTLITYFMPAMAPALRGLESTQ